MTLIRTHGRVHVNGLMSVVDEFRLPDGRMRYEAGVLQRDDREPRREFSDLGAAQTYADGQARADRHDCGGGCGWWIAIDVE